MFMRREKGVICKEFDVPWKYEVLSKPFDYSKICLLFFFIPFLGQFILLIDFGNHIHSYKVNFSFSCNAKIFKNTKTHKQKQIRTEIDLRKLNLCESFSTAHSRHAGETLRSGIPHRR